MKFILIVQEFDLSKPLMRQYIGTVNEFAST